MRIRLARLSHPRQDRSKLKVCDLPLGWTLHAMEGPNDVGSWVPIFTHRKRKGLFAPTQLAPEEGSRAVFHSLKRQLDIMDRTWMGPGEDPRYKAADAAIAILREALPQLGKWSDDLMDTGVHEIWAREQVAI